MRYYEEILDILSDEDDKYLISVFIDRMKNYFENCDTQDINTHSILSEVVDNVDLSKLSKNLIADIEVDFLEGRSSEQILEIVGEHTLLGVSKIALRFYIDNLLEIHGLYYDVFNGETLKALVKKKGHKDFEELSEIDKKCLKDVSSRLAGSFSVGATIKPSLYTFCPWVWLSRKILCSSSLPLDSSDGFYIELCNSTYMVTDSITMNNCREEGANNILEFNFSQWGRAQLISDWLNETKAPLDVMKKLIARKR